MWTAFQIQNHLRQNHLPDPHPPVVWNCEVKMAFSTGVSPERGAIGSEAPAIVLQISPAVFGCVWDAVCLEICPYDVWMYGCLWIS